jgi:hypothetical protein
MNENKTEYKIYSKTAGQDKNRIQPPTGYYRITGLPLLGFLFVYFFRFCFTMHISKLQIYHQDCLSYQ